MTPAKNIFENIRKQIEDLSWEWSEGTNKAYQGIFLGEMYNRNNVQQKYVKQKYVQQRHVQHKDVQRRHVQQKYVQQSHINRN